MTKFSIITPVFDPPLAALQKCIDSVVAQSHSNWEWCLVDDGSTDPNVLAKLRQLANLDHRIKVHLSAVNGGIVAASNTALGLATGEWVVFLDHDDKLALNALEALDDLIGKTQSLDLIYSDEARVDEFDSLQSEILKPSFSPERLRGQNYFNHLTAIRKSLVDEVGGFRVGFDGAQDFDLVLRASEKARSISHLPQVLYFWRAVPGSTAAEYDAKPYAFVSARKAVLEHCDRVGINADVETISGGYVRVKRKIDNFPLVTVVIPTRGDKKRVYGIETSLFENAIISLLENTSYPNIELVLVHDNPDNVSDGLNAVLQSTNSQIIGYSKDFDFSDKCNLGAVHARGSVLVFLNDDIEIRQSDWLENLVVFLEEKDIGIVGPLLRLEDGRIQSAGHKNAPWPVNYLTGSSINAGGRAGEAFLSREVSGITGACLAIRSETFFELGGMSRELPLNFNDVDLCCKAIFNGYRVIWTPLSEVWHFESLTRETTVSPFEIERISSRWRSFLKTDVYTP